MVNDDGGRCGEWRGWSMSRGKRRLRSLRKTTMHVVLVNGDGGRCVKQRWYRCDGRQWW